MPPGWTKGSAARRTYDWHERLAVQLKENSRLAIYTNEVCALSELLSTAYGDHGPSPKVNAIAITQEYRRASRQLAPVE